MIKNNLKLKRRNNCRVQSPLPLYIYIQIRLPKEKIREKHRRYKKEMTSVKVAVRVRPFNKREKDQNSKLIIRMEGGKNTYIKNPVSFTFHFQPSHTLHF